MGNSNRVWILMGKQLSGSIEADEVIELENLLEQNPEIWYSYELLIAINKRDELPETFLKELNTLLEESATSDQLNSLVLSRSKSSRNGTYRSRKLLLYGSAFFLLTLSFITGWYFIQKPEVTTVALNALNEIVAPKGSKTQITLTDGTEIMLNAGSKLVYAKNFSMENRPISKSDV